MKRPGKENSMQITWAYKSKMWGNLLAVYSRRRMNESSCSLVYLNHSYSQSLPLPSPPPPQLIIEINKQANKKKKVLKR